MESIKVRNDEVTKEESKSFLENLGYVKKYLAKRGITAQESQDVIEAIVLIFGSVSIQGFKSYIDKYMNMKKV